MQLENRLAINLFIRFSLHHAHVYSYDSAFIYFVTGYFPEFAYSAVLVIFHMGERLLIFAHFVFVTFLSLLER